MNDKFAFLLSTRFWAIVLGSASTILVSPDFATDEWYVSLGKFIGYVATGFTVVRTIDRNIWDK